MSLNERGSFLYIEERQVNHRNVLGDLIVSLLEIVEDKISRGELPPERMEHTLRVIQGLEKADGTPGPYAPPSQSPQSGDRGPDKVQR